MKISQENKEEIQWFVYFLFKGTLSPELLFNKENYIDEFIDQPEKLVTCFEIFSEAKSKDKEYNKAVKDVVKYITTSNFNKTIELSLFWKELVRASEVFCYNQFEFPIKSFKLSNLNGCGSDAVPYFATWTNTLEIDETGNCLNSEMALKRANERLLLWDSHPAHSFKAFSEKELMQEIY